MVEDASWKQRAVDHTVLTEEWRNVGGRGPDDRRDLYTLQSASEGTGVVAVWTRHDYIFNVRQRIALSGWP